MAEINTELYCCGLSEFNGFSDFRTPKQLLLWLSRERRESDKRLPFVIFSNPTNRGRDRKLINLHKYIKNNKLGEVTKMPRAKLNPNSGNYIKTFTWSVHRKNLRKWFNKNK